MLHLFTSRLIPFPLTLDLYTPVCNFLLSTSTVYNCIGRLSAGLASTPYKLSRALELSAISYPFLPLPMADHLYSYTRLIFLALCLSDAGSLLIPCTSLLQQSPHCPPTNFPSLSRIRRIPPEAGEKENTTKGKLLLSYSFYLAAPLLPRDLHASPYGMCTCFKVAWPRVGTAQQGFPSTW